MQKIYAYNFVTFSNCGRAKYLSQKYNAESQLYDVPFYLLDDVEIEHLIKVTGLYPIPFFLPKLKHGSDRTEELDAIRNLWRSTHILETGLPLELTANGISSSDFHDPICLVDNHWGILSTKYPDPISEISHALKRKGNIEKSTSYPPPTKEKPLSQSIRERLLKTRLPHAIVATLANFDTKFVKRHRDELYGTDNVFRKTFVQKRVLSRHKFNQLALFIAVQIFEMLISQRQSPIEAYLNTVEAIEHSPTIQANLSEDCCLSVNLYHWLTTHGFLPSLDPSIHRIATTESFPTNFMKFFDLSSQSPIPYIREMGIFEIPKGLDQEHVRLLEAINRAIQERTSLSFVLHQYYEGAFR